ncbi:MAG TPA: DUF4397 domain-containing protein [Chitinophagaceae bacterium]|nr:DUF4397 domain-containing protein [Chitinophagaceae bacterium]
MNNNQGLTPQTGLFIIHASAQIPAVDIYANSMQVNRESFVYGQNSEGYLGLTPNLYSFNFSTAGTQNILVSQSDSLGVFKLYSLILYDSLPSPRLMCIQDNFSQASTTSSNWRFLDLSPDIPWMNVFLDHAEVFDSRTFADNLGAPALDTFLKVSPGSHQVILQYPSGGDTIQYQSTFNFTTGNVFTVYSSGFGSRNDSLGLRLNLTQNF